MDPLSDVLSLLKPRSYVSRGFSAGGDWAIRFAPYDGIKFNAVLSGRCWLAMEGVADPLRLEEGDCFLLPKGRPFRLASDLAVTPGDAVALFGSAPRGGVAFCNGGGGFFPLRSRLTFAGAPPPHFAPGP